MRQAAKTLRLFVFLVFVAPLLDCCADQYVEVTAEIEYVGYHKTPTLTETGEVKRFTSVCVVGQNQWRIDNDYERGADTTWMFDGTNVYKRSHLTQAPSKETEDRIRKMGFRPTPFAVAKTNVTINVDLSTNGCPLDHEGVNLPWLAFCSGSYISRAGRMIPLPIAFLRHSPDAFGYIDKTEVFQDPLGLPRRIDLYTDRAALEKSILRIDFMGLRDVKRWLPAFHGAGDGQLKFHYAATRWTNVVGWTFPMEFEFTQIAFTTNGDGIVRFRGDGRVLSMRLLADIGNVFATELKKPSWTGDSRNRRLD